MLVCLFVKMLHILVMCPVLLVVGVQTLTIDSQLGTSIEDCFERISIGDQLPKHAIYRNVSELTTRECEQICKQDKQCQAYDYGVGAKGNATCDLSNVDEKELSEKNILQRHPDYDVYVRRFQCEQSPPTPIQIQMDDPGEGPQHRPVFRPDDDDAKRPLADDYLVSADLGNRPDDYNSNKPLYDAPPSYGAHTPQDIPFRPERPSHNQSNYHRPDPNDVLQFQDPNGRPKPGYWRPPANEPSGPNRPDPYRPEINPYEPEKLNYHYIVRPNRKPQNKPEADSGYGHKPVQPSYGLDPGHPSGPIGPPERPNRPDRPYNRPSYNYNSQYASNYGQNSHAENNYLYLEINDPPNVYKPVKDRPNYDQGIYGYGSYSGQNAYSQSQNSQANYYGSITDITDYGQHDYNKPNRPRPVYGPPNLNEGYGTPSKPNNYKPSDQGYGNQNYGSNSNNYGSQSSGYGLQSTKKPSDTYKPSYGSSQSYGNNIEDFSSQTSGYGSKPGGYGDTQEGYGTQTSGYGSQPTKKPNESNRPSYGGNQGGYGSDQDVGSQTGDYGSKPSQKPTDGYNKPSYGSTSNDPYHKPTYSSIGSYGNSQASYSSQSDYNSQTSHSSSNQYYGSSNRPYYDSQAGSQKPDNKPSHSSQGYGSQGDYGSNQISHESGYGHRPVHGNDYESHTNGYEKPQKPSKPAKPSYPNDGGYTGHLGTGYGNQGSYGSTQSSHSSSQEYYGSQQTSYNSHAYGTSQIDHGHYQGGSGNQGYGNNQSGYGNSQAGYGSNLGSYGSNQASYGSNQPSYGSNKPSYDSNPPSYGSNQASYGSNQPSYDSNRPSYGSNKPIYDSNSPSYGSNQASYGSNQPSYDSNRPSYGSNKPSYDGNRPSYGINQVNNDNSQASYGSNQASYGENKPNDGTLGYSTQRPSYDNQTIRPSYLDVKPVYEYDSDRPSDAPSYISRPNGDVVTSRPMVIGDYGANRPAYGRDPGHVSYKACFRRVLAGKRALRSHVRRVLSCERVEDCRRECASEGRFACESFNYRLDPSFRGKGLCELMTKPIEAFDLHRDFVEDKEYDFYERDRNSLEPNCPDTLRGPGSLHSGYLSSKPDRVGYQSGWRDRNDWVDRRHTEDRFYDERGNRNGNRRFEHHYVPYQIGIGRSNEDENWGRYGGVYGGSSNYYKDQNDYHKSIDHWRLVTETPRPNGVKSRNTNFDYNSLAKKNVWDRYGYGSWKRGRWNSGATSNRLEYGESNEFKPSKPLYYEPIDRSDESSLKDCSSRRRPGMSLSSGAIRRSLIARSVVDCETACFGEREFKCVSYSYRYSISHGTDNCFLSERPYRGLELAADSGSDVYAMPQDQGCATINHTPWVESECFWHVRSGAAVSEGAVRAALTVAGLGACEAECIRAQGFFCRGFSFRYDSPTIGDELENCILTSSPPTSLEIGRGVRPHSGHELYSRGNYGRGCEPALYDDTHHKDKECYLQYDSAARLTGTAIRGQLSVKDEMSCGSACTEAPFRCLSFSYNNNAPPNTDNCLLSEIRLFDLQKGVDYVHSIDDWLFAFDLFNGQCWRKVHGKGDYEEPSSELPRPIPGPPEDHSLASGPSGPGYLPDYEAPHLPPSGPPSGPSYKPYPPSHDAHKPTYPSEPHHSYQPSHHEPGTPDYLPGYKPGYQDGPIGPGYRPGYSEPGGPIGPSYKPGYPETSGPGFKPSFPPSGPNNEPGYPESERPPYGPGHHEPNRPGYKPGYHESSGPGFKPEPNHPAYRPRPDHNEPTYPGLKPGYAPERPGHKPGYIPDRPSHRPDSGPGYRPKPEERPGRPGDREEHGLGSVSWRHYSVSGFPCRTGTTCAQNVIAGHWACEPEGGEIGSWDYCCSPTHRCGYSEGFHKPWCYVGPTEDQWRPCSEKYYPYQQPNVPHPSQGHRDEHRPVTRPHQDGPAYIPDRPVGPYLSEADRKYWDELYKNGPQAYYDKHGNPLPGYSRVPTEHRPYIKYNRNEPRPSSGHWVQVPQDKENPPSGLGVPRYWPVAYLHKEPPPNSTYFRYNETDQTTTTTESLSRELPDTTPQYTTENYKRRDEKTRKINITDEDNIFQIDSDKVTSTIKSVTEAIPEEKEEMKVNASEVETAQAESIIDNNDFIKGIDGKLVDFSRSIEVLDLDDARKGEKLSDLKTLEAEERQIEAIGRLLASRRGSKIILEKRSQKDLDSKSIAVDKDLVDFNFGNRFPTSERRGLIQKVSKDEIEKDRNTDRSLEVSETTFVRPPRVLSTTENIRKAIVNGKVFYDATIRDQRDLFHNSTRKPKSLRPLEERAPSVINSGNFGRKKIIKPRNVNPVRKVRRVYRKRYNPEEVRRRLLEREKNTKVTNENSTTI